VLIAAAAARALPSMTARIPTSLFALLLSLWPAVAAAQSRAEPPVEGWDGARALELIRRAQERRSVTLEDTAMVNYSADARAFVYFYLDREDTGERNLIKTDQVALQVFWEAPDRVKQRIVGWRDEHSLPNRIHYHIDHLAVVQENFGDEIRIGDGDEVQGVPHPAAPGSERFYQFQLTDSLTLRLPGAAEPVQVYQVQARPRDHSQPAIIGSVFIDRRSGDLVRMDFTFTSASYVDPYLDYINISLDNGLWRGRFWLPNEQRVELRRRLPMLDVPAGTIIRANMRVGGYEFNQLLHPATFIGPAIVAVPRAQREAFPFEEEIFAELREQGLGPEMELGEIRSAAMRLARRQALERFSPVRLSAGSLSEVVRFNRSEGWAVGMGATVTPHPALRLRGSGGYAFGAGHPYGAIGLEVGEASTRVGVRVHANEPRDLAPGPAASGFGNTLSAVFAGRDHTDIFFADGVAGSVTRRLSPAWSLDGRIHRARHTPARGSPAEGPMGREPRPLFPALAGDMTGAEVGVRRHASYGTARWTAGQLVLDAGSFQPLCPNGCPDDLRFSRVHGSMETGWRWQPRDARLEVGAGAGAAWGELPAQSRFWLGGRGTVPGYHFRSLVGERFVHGRATGSADLDGTWLRARLHGGFGWANGTGGAVRPTVGAGVGILHDILHVDLHRGLGTAGRWELIVESNRGFWDFL
jgi:hypothetical protein